MSNNSSVTAPIIRKFSSADVATVFTIASASPEAAQWSLDSYLALDGATHPAWLINAASQTCGFLISRVIADQAEILNLAILSGYRRIGMAHLLLHEAFGEFRARNIHSVFLEVRESNLPAQTFYKKHGFVITGLRPAYYQDSGEAAILMAQRLVSSQ